MTIKEIVKIKDIAYKSGIACAKSGNATNPWKYLTDCEIAAAAWELGFSSVK